MDLYTVMTEIDTRLKTITGLRVAEFGYPGSVTGTTAVQYPPDRINFDGAYGRGMDDYDDHLIVVLTGMANRRAALKRLAPFLRGSGAQSIKACLDPVPIVTAWASCSDVTVKYAEIDMPKLGGVEYLAALFHCKITGVGA
jgi:hypothetical protein